MVELKRHAEEDNTVVEQLEDVRKKQQRDIELMTAQIQQMQADNEKLNKSKKKIQAEVNKRYTEEGCVLEISHSNICMPH